MPKLNFSKNSNQFLDYSFTSPSGKSGTETLIIYIHGFASHQRGEKVLFLQERFNEIGTAFLAFDHRGHGNSSGTMKGLTVTKNLEDLGQIIQFQGENFKNLVLIGSSMGGQTAAWYAANHPNQIDANLLIAPAFRFLENRKRELGPQGLKSLEEKGEITIKNDWVEVTIGKELVEDAQNYPVETLLQKYQTPTLMIHGLNDESVPISDSFSFIQASKARPSELLMIAGGDHRLTQHKDTLFLYMKTFLKKMGLI
ncbi:MAG TPA: alpha/beta fold hydrolase [Nitrospiria bacterium]|jgi:pimeloyl-ACP methyl ester carboxylesterase